MITLTTDEARSIAHLLEHAGYEYTNLDGLEDTDEAPAMFAYHKILTAKLAEEN